MGCLFSCFFAFYQMERFLFFDENLLKIDKF